MSDLVTSETVTEEVQPETQVKFRNHVTFFLIKIESLDCLLTVKALQCKVQVVIN